MPPKEAETTSSSGALSIEESTDRIRAVLASIAGVERELEACAAGTSSLEDKTRRVGQLKGALNEYINTLKSLHGEMVHGGIVKDPKGLGGSGASASAPDGAHVEVPVEVIEYLDQGKNPDEALRLVFGSVLKRGQDVKGKEQALQTFYAAATASATASAADQSS